MNKPQQNSPDQEWQPCSPGQLKTMVDGLNSQQRELRRRQLASRATAVIGVIALFVVGLVVTSNLRSELPGGIACSEAIQLMAQAQVENLSVELQNTLSAHLLGCPHCREKRDQMKQGVGEASVPEASSLVALALTTKRETIIQARSASE